MINTFSTKCVGHLDRVLAGCCWEVHATRVNPPESLPSLHQVAKCLTMELAVCLAEEVAAILRAVLTHDAKKLYNDGTVHLLCSNYWIQPIYQELLHSSSRHNATGKEKESGPAVAWPGLLRTLGRPRSGSHQFAGMVSGPLGPSGPSTAIFFFCPCRARYKL